jgi:hypothetical protein
MKLKFLFLLMDLATLAAIPVVYTLGKLRQLSKIIEGETFAASTVR